MDIATIVERIRNDSIDLQPDFQRGQVWHDSKKKRLVDTILRQWYIPAIHLVVNDDLDSEEVLDGQQRLRAILEFMNDGFCVDGRIEPHDETIASLHGLTFSNLPPSVRSRFRRFTINTVRLRDYSIEEPGELFFRLNQLTALTAAEQRNALIGETRNQVRKLASQLEDRLSGQSIGFSNARMNYDDTIARVAIALELGRLHEKVTAAGLERRYRRPEGFSPAVIATVSSAVEGITEIVRGGAHTRLNRASLFSWMFFLADHKIDPESASFEDVTLIFEQFESARSGTALIDELLGEKTNHPISRWPEGKACIRVFNDRASSRVNDVSSVVLRDLCLNVCAALVTPDGALVRRLAQGPIPLPEFRSRLARLPDDVAERAIAEATLAKLWERYRENR